MLVYAKYRRHVGERDADYVMEERPEIHILYRFRIRR